MSMKVSRYFIVFILLIIITLISTSFVDATCYVTPGGCMRTQPADGIDYISLPDTLVESDYCISAYEADLVNPDDIAYQCILGCCCHEEGGQPIGIYPMTQGYCSFNNIAIGNINSAEECSQACAALDPTAKYTFSGFVMINDLPVALANVSVTISEGVNVSVLANGNGFYIFNNIPPGNRPLFAFNNDCSKSDSISLTSDNMKHNISLDCPDVTLSGNVYKSGALQYNTRVNITYGGNILSVTSDSSGHYSFEIPSRNQIYLEAYDNSGCKYSTDLTISTIDVTHDITLSCDNYNLDVTVSDGSGPVNDATVRAGSKVLSVGSGGVYSFTELAPGSYTVTASRTTVYEEDGNDVERTCTGTVPVVLNGPQSVDLTLSSCCTKTTSYTECTSGFMYKTVTSIGTGCSNPGTVTTRQTCDIGESCWECTDEWSSCDGGEVLSYRTCTYNEDEESCNANLPPPEMTRPCNTECGNGNLQTDLGEECDYDIFGNFELTTTCLNTWHQVNDDITEEYINQNQLWSIICSPTCKCSTPTTPGDIPDCSEDPGNVSNVYITVDFESVQYRISWELEKEACRSYVDHFELRMCTGMQCDGNTYVLIDNNVNSAVRTYSIPMTDFEDRCVEVTAIFRDTVIESHTESHCLRDMGDSECFGEHTDNWCRNNDVVNCDNNNRIVLIDDCTADESCGIINDEAQCYSQGDCDMCNNIFGIYSYVDGIIITDGGSEYECPSMSWPHMTETGCYLDYSTTSIDKAYSCSDTLSCYDYYSEDSCTQDYCGKFQRDGVIQCEWVSYSYNDVTNAYRKGVCRPINETEQKCDLCNDDDANRLFPKCTKDICELFGECYFEPQDERCIKESEVVCGTYTNESECIGDDDSDNGRSVFTNVNWVITDGISYDSAVKVSGSNVRTPSDDAVGLGVCFWNYDTDNDIYLRNIGKQCVRNADNLAYIYNRTMGYGNDCVMRDSELRYKCELDTIPPVTVINNRSSVYGLYMNLKDQVILTDNINWPIGDSITEIERSVNQDFIKTYYCIVRQGEPPCYPYRTLSTSRIINLSASGISRADDGDTLNMYFFSQDPARNLELLKRFDFSIDALEPEIEFSITPNSYPLSEYFWRTNLTVNIWMSPADRSLPVTCSFNITPQTDDAITFFAVDRNYGPLYNIPSMINTGANKLYSSSDRITTIYPGLVDGRYIYELRCTDALGNPAYRTGTFSVTGDMRINSPQPNGTIFRAGNPLYYNPDTDVFNIDISVNTINDAVCKYTTNPLVSRRYTDMEETMQSSDRQFHRSTITIDNPSINSAIYKYYVGCDITINGRNHVVYGNDMSNPYFSIDDLAPMTRVYHNNYSTGVDNLIEYTEETPPSEYVRLTLVCNDSSQLLTSSGGEEMSFGCAPDSTYYCIPRITSNIDCTDTGVPGAYIRAGPYIELNYQSSDSEHRRLFGNNPTIYYYSSDRGGNIAPPSSTTLHLRNTQFDDPQITLILGDGSETAAPGDSIDSAFITILVNYSGENYVNITNFELWHMGRSVQVPISAVNDILTGTNLYRFTRTYFDNGEYQFIIDSIDDDTNTKRTTASFTVSHAGNVVWLVSPKLGIGQSQTYDITLATAYPGRCKYGFDPLEKCPTKACIYNDPTYTTLTSSGTQHTLIEYTHTGQYNMMYVICWNSGSMDEYADSAFAQTSFNVGYNLTSPDVNITFVHNPLTKPDDNRIINPLYNATTVRIFTDQPSVCQINASFGRQVLDIPLTPPTWFNNEDPNVYNKYYTVHNFTIDYKQTGAGIGLYNYTVNCTSHAQLNTIKGFQINFAPNTRGPVVTIRASEQYIGLHRYNVTCQGLCMDTYQQTYRYKTIPQSQSCSAQAINTFTLANYSQLIDLRDSAKICVMVTDVLGRNGTAEINANVLDLDQGQLTINYPYIYNLAGKWSHVYSPTQSFTLDVSTPVNAVCRYTTDLNAQRYNNIADIYDNSNSFTNTASTRHTTPFSITATANYPEGYFISCMAQNVASGTDPYIGRALVFYWDDTAPSVSANVTPEVIVDWNLRDTVTFNVTTSDDSRCVLDLEDTIVDVTQDGTTTHETLGTGTAGLDAGEDSNFTSYGRNRVKTYYLPNTWLNDIDIDAVYNFNIDCWNRAMLYSDTVAISRYDLASAVIINRTSSDIFNTTTVPVNITTNINSTCSLTVDNSGTIYRLNTVNNLVHYTVLNVGSGGNHTISITCSVGSHSGIAAGQETYQVIVDSEKPVVTSLSSTAGRNYTCSLDGFSINVAMSDDTGIVGYYYSISGISASATVAQYRESGNYGLITFDGNLTENAQYTVSVRAVDRAGRYSDSKSITIIARTPATSILCDSNVPQAIINTADTPFLDMVRVNVSCSDDTGCRPIYYYSTTNNANCGNATYSISASFNNLLTFMNNTLLCVKVMDLAGNTGYGQKNITIGADMSNPLNITPIDNDDSLAIYPNAIATTVTPFDLSISTSVNAVCKYGVNPIANMSVADLFNERYMDFSQTGGRVHIIEGFDVGEDYETYIDVICHSTAITTQPYSRKVIRVVYTAINPSISATADPDKIFDWNERTSTITVNTLPETWCAITSSGNADTTNTPVDFGEAFNALTYKTSHVEEFDYKNLGNSSRLFEYDVNCYTFTNMHNSTNFTVTYNISNTLSIILLSPQIQRNRTAEVLIETGLISTCRLTWNGVDRGIMMANVSGRQHSIKILTQADGVYTAEVNCSTEVTGLRNSRAYNITINTTVPPVRCGDGLINRQGEECDGNELDGVSCEDFTNRNYVGGELKCYPAGTVNECKYDYSNCDSGAGWCGNDEVEGPNSQGMMEQCDGSVPSDLTCKLLGFSGGSLRCNNDACTINTSRCTQTTGTLGNTNPVCGNGLLQTGEQCETNSSDDIFCTSFGYDTGGVSCNSTCMYDLSKCEFDIITGPGVRCGNNRQEGREQCDGSDLDGYTCMKLSNYSLGINYTGGTLRCYPAGTANECTFNVTKCIGVSIGINTSNKCTNGIKDAGETDVDCGGSCPPCKTLNSSCNKDSDCASGKCTLGKCVVHPCNNSVFDSATETDIDCGKTCSPCGLGKNCVSAADCISRYCSPTGTCTQDPCNNGLLDPGEVDVDCGGSCTLCDVGQNCVEDSDCGSNNCRKGICQEPKDPVNPVKLPLLLFGIIATLGGGGYLVYRTFIEKKPIMSTGIKYPPFGSSSNDEMNTIQAPMLTPEQREELMRRQQEALSKNRQSRMSKRRSVLDKLDEDTAKDTKEKVVTKATPEPKKIKKYTSDDGEYVDLDKLSKDDEEYVDINKLAKSKNVDSKDTFDKLNAISGAKAGSAAAAMTTTKSKGSRSAKSKSKKGKIKPVEETAENDATNPNPGTTKDKTIEAEKTAEDKNKTADDSVSKQIAEISGKPHDDIKSRMDKNTKLEGADALKIFGDLSKDTIMSEAFTDVLSKLLDSGKMSKENVSNILFEYMDKGLLTKSDVARISSDLKII